MGTCSLGAEETSVDIPRISLQERVRTRNESLEADFEKLATKIHRFPPGLRAVENRYIVPSFVAIGPYHHDSAQLQHAEDIKHAAAHFLCEQSGRSIEQVYRTILSVADRARSCYAIDDETVARLNDADFAEMMFLDGCFLLSYIVDLQSDLLLNRMTLSTGPCMLRDIFLLENQLPFLVLDALMTSFPAATRGSVCEFVAASAQFFNISQHSSDSVFWMLSNAAFQKYSPPHLLGLLQYYQSGRMMQGDPGHDHDMILPFSFSSSAVELAEIGIEMTANDKPWFDMSVDTDRFLFPKLSLTPVFLNDINACWLVNMAAYETCTSTAYPSDGFLVSSYISLLAMLLDKEEDVHELRAKHIVHGFFSNHEVLVFFKEMSRHLRLGSRYFTITGKIQQFKRHSHVRIALHRFIYNNFRIIVALLSIASVLVGIFRTLMSLKQHQQ